MNEIYWDCSYTLSLRKIDFNHSTIIYFYLILVYFNEKLLINKNNINIIITYVKIKWILINK
jgi:hypothetical protein